MDTHWERLIITEVRSRYGLTNRRDIDMDRCEEAHNKQFAACTEQRYCLHKLSDEGPTLPKLDINNFY